MKKKLSDYIKSPEDFNHFCNLFLKKEVSPFVKVYDAPGRDGGIDADYTGHYKEKNGTWIFQYKFFDPTMDKNRARSQLISKMKGGKRKKGELDKADALQCDHYVLMTNTSLTAGNKRKIEDAKNEKGYTFSLTLLGCSGSYRDDRCVSISLKFISRSPSTRVSALAGYVPKSNCR